MQRGISGGPVGGDAWCAQYSPIVAASAMSGTAAKAGEGSKRWADSGTVPTHCKPWSWGAALAGTVVGVALLALGLPFVLVVMLYQTAAEVVRHNLGFDPYVTQREEGKHEDVTIVIPGVCGSVFWQLGMLQYVCEHFDTSGAKLSGVSSGALGSAMVLAMESAAVGASTGREAAERVRRVAQRVFMMCDKDLAPITWWPVGFLGRLGFVLDKTVATLTPDDLGDISRRVSIGMRRVTSSNALPATLPHTVTGIKSKAELLEAVRASSTVWFVVRPGPWVQLRNGDRCSDGVNPFSLYCFIEYLIQWKSGLSQRTCPEHMSTGLDKIYPIWNCGVMRMLTARRGRNLWVSPTVGGHLSVFNLLNFSGRVMLDQWREGYIHACELDKKDYWQGLPRRDLNS